ncbi:MAG: S9 family peptidase [Acidobacteriota bacterium]
MRRQTIIRFLVLLCLALINTQVFAQRDRLSIEQFLDWEYVASPQISPDGRQIIYTRHWPDKVNDKYEDEIWIMDADGGHNRFLAKGSQGRWAPDSKRLAYVAQGQPTGAQIFLKWIDLPGETQLTRLERGPSNLAWSPDGKRIAFTMNVPGGSGFTVKMPAHPQGAKWIEAPRVVERLNYRNDGSGWRPEGFTHIFLISDQGGTPRQLTNGDYQHGAPEWLPDSRTVIFSGVRKDDAEYLRFGSEIYSMSVDSGAIRALTNREGPDNNPEISPDGRLIAYTGFDRNDNTYNVTKLYVMNTDGTRQRVLTANFDRSPNGAFWAEDNSGLYFTTEDKGSQNVWFQPIAGGAPEQITTGSHVLNISSMSRNGVMSGTWTAPQTPGDVVTLRMPARGRDTRGRTVAPVGIGQLTAVNADLLEGRKLGAVEEIWYDSVGGMKVQGWIVKPPDFDAQKKYPLILYIHGGPHTMYSVGFNFEFQNHAANGYVVLYTNPRGSTGYGQTFGNAINNNYPGEDYDDLMRGVDEVVKRGYIDERNLFVTGGSGGGVLSSWIIGHTDRFAAAVVMKPVTNWYSFVGTTDGADWYYNFKKLPWDDPSEHLRRSPITYVGNVKTPTLLIDGELDLRTPIAETEQYYRALKFRKVDTAMVRLADEYHGFNADFGLRHPSNRLSQILFLRGWFEKYKRK